MAMTRWVVLCCCIITVPSLCGSQTKSPGTMFERRLDLLGPVAPPPHTAAAMPDGGGSGAEGRKSVGLAAVYSLLLPGMGELYAGGFTSGRYFLAAEGVLWLTYAAFDVYGTSLRSDARVFAQVHAGADPSGKPDQFFVDVGNYLNTADYNETKLRNRQLDKVYDPAAGYGWQWDSDASRAAFRDERVKSENMYNNRKFVVAAVLINHLASAINAARTAIAHNKALSEQQGSLEFGASVMGGIAQPHGIMVTVVKHF